MEMCSNQTYVCMSCGFNGDSHFVLEYIKKVNSVTLQIFDKSDNRRKKFIKKASDIIDNEILDKLLQILDSIVKWKN